MRNLIFAISLLLCSIAAKGDDTYFPYPTPPAELSTLRERTNYLVEHFWDRCDLKGAFSSHAKLAGAFDDYISFMPYAAADTVHQSIDKLIKKVSKTPKNLLVLAEIAENALYGDSAEMVSDEVYLPFAKAVADCKKLSDAERARFVHQAKVLSQSQAGQIFPDIKLTLADGSSTAVSDYKVPYTLIFINDPDCSDCRIARALLTTNYDAQRLTESNTVAVISVYPDTPDELWHESITDYPQGWVVSASDDVIDRVDIRIMPTFYFLDSEKRIVAKNIPVENVINAMALIPTQAQPQVTESPTVEGTNN